MTKGLRWLVGLAIVATLAGCGVAPRTPTSPTPSPAMPSTANIPVAPGPLTGSLTHPKSRWQPVDWSELPGFADDPLHEGWIAMIANCARPNAVFAPLCQDVRRLAIADDATQRQWMIDRLQPYRVESLAGQSDGQLTSYYEPVYEASRRPSAQFNVPLYAAPPGLVARRPWFTRQQIETLPEAQAAVRGREIAWMADPVDAMMLHIQGSGRLRITEPDGSQRIVRVAFAGTNEQPYRSIQQWLISQGVGRVSRWPDDTKAWVAQNPQRVQQLMWSNPRYVFFREEALSELDAAFGPRGAQGVPLTAGRSIAVDRDSIPYGTPVWLASPGPTVQLQKLVVAQDTGSAILGAVRADYFAGTGQEAGRLAATVNQPLRLWALWPK
ncbi:murein transglycosylase A [Variovorax ginsengisoli]|uniref:peptidoglycan lytic exotransglycosylase n=1 Tax=Variovorax ginsengisoli TaxID=363844 RepID=A0ABT9S7C1_9BURK|nr:MltA domain-containing protein [Variovorax ginsengisoli]MDP9900253.1 membrane-bound lytic murein transglycosylase A [Variovorax ginsengisoli]